MRGGYNRQDGGAENRKVVNFKRSAGAPCFLSPGGFKLSITRTQALPQTRHIYSLPVLGNKIPVA